MAASSETLKLELKRLNLFDLMFSAPKKEHWQKMGAGHKLIPSGMKFPGNVLGTRRK